MRDAMSARLRSIMARVALLAGIGLPLSAIGQPQAADDQNNAEFAKYVVVQSIVLSLKHGGRFEDPATGELVSNAASLGISVLARSRAKSSPEHLAGLLAYSLDGVIGEEHTCAVLMKGKAMISHLFKAQKDGLVECRKTAEIRGVAPSALCTSTDKLARDVTLIVAAIRDGDRCKH